jgi:hypothetical protein
MYMQLTEAEASFRALKSELTIRPLFHQKEPRVKAHVLVAFLGYALWVTLKHLLAASIGHRSSTGGVDNAQPLSPDQGTVFAVHPAQRQYRTCPLRTGERFACAVVPSPSPNRNLYCTSSASVCRNV